ncbi:TPA: cobalamin biosynthesis protein CobQ [Patescibacteria group bacterium]|uniref:Lipid II isoglutaminyl synthase (glutamine-hydrolyzing) subunit GatD n=1 Tax=Candidatus Gottesmanbacteria bacterium GW2011_GWA1_43_11 TaxID=1618436 RepID=A0A0G1EP34_9BACT|nr:MAG: CobB/CobQ domain protein glutamine amidotransferase [Candidatus Gottesmanbacteria bacterium GW2011_GWA1_43_11]HCS79497.1 cobalamin biosynthesis protein CobQ [Patescibacteria group bacterium]
MNLTISWFYPDLMSTYGDRGNIIVLKKRCEWRGIEVKIQEITLESPLSQLGESDLLFMGGAQDRQQKLVSDDFLHKKAPVMKKMIEKNIPALLVCAAYQFAGHYYQPYQGEKIPGAGIFDLYTKHLGDQTKRQIGNVTAELINSKFRIKNSKFGKIIVGFENHGGRTYLGKNIKPLAKVIKGFGNNGEDDYEGAIYKNAIGSYFHGPLLPKNPHLADLLIQKALEVKYQREIKLVTLNDELEFQAQKAAVNKV